MGDSSPPPPPLSSSLRRISLAGSKVVLSGDGSGPGVRPDVPRETSQGYHAGVTSSSPVAAGPRRRAAREIVIYGLCCGAFIAALQLVEFQFLVVDRSVQTYGVLVAVLFAVAGVWLGRRMARGPAVVEEVPVPVAGPFVLDRTRQRELGITPRELEILGLIAEGLSNREIAERLFVSENTIKTHSSRLFDKLGAKRRTQAVQLGKAARLIP